MSLSQHALIVDDDRRIRELLVAYLKAQGYRVTAAASAAECRELLKGLAFDIIILDVMMPGENGLQLSASLRKLGNETPILMLSALTDTSDRIKGLASGSDDYLAKPFEPEELLLRMRSMLRRSLPKSAPPRHVNFGDCAFDMETGALMRGIEPVHLTGREKEMLRMLVGAAGKPVARHDLRADSSDESARAVDVQINRLRQKIEHDPANPVLLQTVRGEGYVLFAEALAP